MIAIVCIFHETAVDLIMKKSHFEQFDQKLKLHWCNFFFPAIDNYYVFIRSSSSSPFSFFYFRCFISHREESSKHILSACLLACVSTLP